MELPEKRDRSSPAAAGRRPEAGDGEARPGQLGKALWRGHGGVPGLYEDDGSALTNISAARKQLEELARFDAKFLEALASLESAKAAIEDVSATARDYADGIDASPERLAEVEDRLALIDRLKRKYGSTVDEVIAYGEDVARKLNELENREDVVRELKKQLGCGSGGISERGAGGFQEALQRGAGAAEAGGSGDQPAGHESAVQD